MRKKYFLALLVFTVLVLQSQTQRGGGRRRSSYRIRRSGTSLLSLFASMKKTGSQNSTDIFEFLFGQNQENSTDSFDYTLQNGCKIQDSNPQHLFVWIGCAITVSLFCLCRNGKFQYGNDPDKEFKRITDSLEQTYEINWSFSKQKITQKVMNPQKFMQTQWKVQIRVGFLRNVQTWDLRIKNITKNKDYAYEFEAEGFNDKNGNSNIKGVLLFDYKGMGICFYKRYVKRQQNQKVGKWDLLIYKGYENDNGIKGRWYYRGFGDDLHYSGEMKMIPK